MRRLAARALCVAPKTPLRGLLSVSCVFRCQPNAVAEFQAGHETKVEVSLPGGPRGESAQSDSSADAENFDEIEASAQELHDLASAMIVYLRKTDVDQNPLLMDRRAKPRNRQQVENVIKYHNQYLYKSAKYKYHSKKELSDATDVFLQFGSKLLVHLTDDVVARMLHNTRTDSAAATSDLAVGNRAALLNILKRRQVCTAKHYRHAPFELKNLRSDIPESVVDIPRAKRDKSTLSMLQTLIVPQHPFREALEKRLWTIMEKYDATQRGL